MLFSSITFLYYFLPAAVILYCISPKKLKNAVLLFSSLIFYGWGEPKYLLLMSAAIILGYTFGLLIEKAVKSEKPKTAKALVGASSAVSLGMLCYFKYTDFFIENINAAVGTSLPLLQIALPIGISFYTFQIMSYSIDVYRGTAAAQKNIINFGAYASMFPQLIAGPIVRYSDISSQLTERKHSLKGFSDGLARFIIGLSKKVLIANVLGELIDTFRKTDERTVLFVWVYAFACALHIYFDFSGYSDMAIGLGKIFGFSFPENFNYPYISKSITEFWRRWHMSLGTWFRDYLYIPLGGNRVSKARHIFNILAVWLATGIWHGASWNFVLWGLYFALFLVLEKFLLLKKLEASKVLSHIYVCFLVLVSFVIFDNENLSSAFTLISQLFGAGRLKLSDTQSLYCLRSYGLVLAAAAVGSTSLPKMLYSKIRQNRTGECILNAAEPFVLAGLLAVCTAFLVDGSFNPFLYFRF